MNPCEPKEVEQGQVQGAAHRLGQFQHQYRVEDERTKSRPEEKSLGILVYENLHVSWQRVLAAQKVKNILCCIYKCNQWVKGAKSHLKYCVHLKGPQHKKDKDVSQKGQGVMVLN